MQPLKLTSLVPGPSLSNTLLLVPELELELCPPPSGSFLLPSTVTLRVKRVPDINYAEILLQNGTENRIHTAIVAAILLSLRARNVRRADKF